MSTYDTARQYYDSHTRQMADKLMRMMHRDSMIENVKASIRYDRDHTQKHVFSELYFLIDPKNGQDPNAWIVGAIEKYDELSSQTPDIVKPNEAPLIKCLFVKKYRKVLQKLRKLNGGQLPSNEEIEVYIREGKLGV